MTDVSSSKKKGSITIQAAGLDSLASGRTSGDPVKRSRISSRVSDRRRSKKSVDVERRQSTDRRMAQRVFTNLEVDYSSDNTFLFSNTASITNLSSMGIFVQTQTPEAVGTRLNLRFTPPNAEHILELEGEVVWVNSFRPGDCNNINPGMGIRLVGLTLEQRQILVDLVRCIALLPDED